LKNGYIIVSLVGLKATGSASSLSPLLKKSNQCNLTTLVTQATSALNPSKCFSSFFRADSATKVGK
jgi:hypothetical protein